MKSVMRTSATILFVATILFCASLQALSAFRPAASFGYGARSTDLPCRQSCYLQHPAADAQFYQCVGNCYYASLLLSDDDNSDENIQGLMRKRLFRSKRRRQNSNSNNNNKRFRKLSTRKSPVKAFEPSSDSHLDEACHTVKCSFMSQCCGGKCYSSFNMIGKTCVNGVVCSIFDDECGRSPSPTVVVEKKNSNNNNNNDDDEEEETGKIHPNRFSKFNATLMYNQLESIVLAALKTSNQDYVLERVMDQEIGAPLYNDVALLSRELLDGFNRGEHEETLSESFEEFLSSLAMPENIRETVEQHSDIVSLNQMLSVKQSEFADREATCLANYQGMIANRYSVDEYKNLFCSYLNALVGSINVLEGQLYAKRVELQGQWYTLINFLDNGYQTALERDTVGLYTTVPSIKSFAQNAKGAINPSLTLSLARSQYLETVMESSVTIDYLTMSQNVTVSKNVTKVVNGVTVTETVTEIKVQEFQVVDTATFYQESDLVVAHNQMQVKQKYAFPKANVTFAIEFGAMAHAPVSVRPNSDWFSVQVMNQYKNGPFRPGYSSSQFFGEHGTLRHYLKTLVLVVDPFVKMTVDQGLKEFIETNKKLTIFNVPFDTTPGTGNSDLQVNELTDYPGVFSVVLRRRNSEPLVLATELTA